MAAGASDGHANLKGVAAMAASMLAFIINDTFLKLSTETLPPFEVLFIRSIFAALWGLPLMGLTRSLGRMGALFDRRVMFRNLMELVAVLGFILGLANVSIADITALSQLAPILVVLGAAVFLKARVTRLQIGLALVACMGALMVAQPGSSAFSLFALFGLWNAVIVAVRDLAGRQLRAEVPGAVVAWGSALIVLAGTGIIGPLTESWMWPDTTQLLMIATSGLFLMGGHFFVLAAYRAAEPGVVAPFFYTSTIWALLSAYLVFGTPPNGLALGGIAVIVTCGVLVVAAEGRSRRKAAVRRVMPPAV